MAAQFNEIVSKIGGVGRHISNYATKAVSIFSGQEDTSSKIRDQYLNGFLGDTSQFSPRVFSRLFDEPTYLTFRIEFNFNDSEGVNYRGSSTDSYAYDDFPEPLLYKPTNLPYKPSIDSMPKLNIDTGFTTNSLLSNNKNFNTTQSFDISSSAPEVNCYSTYNYLLNNLGEMYRAESLNTFIASLQDVQDNYPYYFQSVEGLGDLMKIKQDSGIRLGNENCTIKIKCLEGLDLKITQLMQLYRKAAWDDVYQRWILPDMMRFFNMKIYVSEIRLFHSMSKSHFKPKESILYDIASNMNTTAYGRSNASFGSIMSTIDNILDTAVAVSSKTLGTNSAVTKVLNSADTVMDSAEGLLSLPGDFTRLCNSAFNDVMPTICYDCHQCEFVIDDTRELLNAVDAFTKKEPVSPTITIKIGKLLDKQIYPLNVDLKTTADRYSIDMKGDIMAGAYLDDDTFRRHNDYERNDINNDTLISKGMHRINKNISTSTNKDLAYLLYNADLQMNAMSLTYSIMNNVISQFAPADVFSAATSLKEIKSSLDTGEYADMIKSTATSPEMQNRLKVMTFASVLDNISKSEATSDTALQKLSEGILKQIRDESNKYKSTATESQTEIN